MINDNINDHNKQYFNLYSLCIILFTIYTICNIYYTVNIKYTILYQLLYLINKRTYGILTHSTKHYVDYMI